MKIEILEVAERDMQSSLRFYIRRSPALAVDYLSDFQNACERILFFPEAGTSLNAEIRRLLLKRFPFAIYYRMISETIEVIGILHTRRNPAIWKKRP
jgi:plasmid stabilization system protein ParE